MWEGQPTIETAPSTKKLEEKYGVHPDPNLDRKITAELRNKTEQDYWQLLQSNACLTRKILRNEYASDSAFVDFIGEKLGPC